MAVIFVKRVAAFLLIYLITKIMEIQIKRITIIDEAACDAFEKLLPQLTGRDDAPSAEQLEMIIADEMTHLFVATENDVILGTLTLVLYRIPTNLKGMIEDVIVDEAARGKGVATRLMNHAISVARKNGVAKLELTSNPTRIAANNMYQQLGFEKRNTNFYRMDL